jgi:hypothetical protein
MPLPTCPHCGSEILAGADTCPICGRALTARTTGTRPPRERKYEAVRFGLAVAGLILLFWMPRLGGLLLVGGVVLFVIERFR